MSWGDSIPTGTEARGRGEIGRGERSNGAALQRADAQEEEQKYECEAHGVYARGEVADRKQQARSAVASPSTPTLCRGAAPGTEFTRHRARPRARARAQLKWPLA